MCAHSSCDNKVYMHMYMMHVCVQQHGRAPGMSQRCVLCNGQPGLMTCGTVMAMQDVHN